MRIASFLPLKITRPLFELPWSAPLALAVIGLVMAPEARSQNYLPGTPVDVTETLGNEVNPSITIDPSNAANIFSVAASETAGLVTSYSIDQGKQWATNLIAAGHDNLVPSYGYPSAAFDSYGNLYVAYLPATFEGVSVAISTNFGASFTLLTNLAAADATETPRIVAGPATAPGSVWVVYKDYSQPSTPLMAQGLLATNLGTNSQFGQPLIIPGSTGGGFPDIAIGPAGQVMVAYQNNLTNSGASKIFVSLNTNAFGTNGFGAAVTVTSTAVGGLTYIPAQSTGIGVSATPGVAWDVDPFSPFYGRAYVIYSALASGNALDIGFRYSTNSGATWSAQEIVNDDTSGNSHFMPRIAVDPVTGIVACSWYDCRNDQGGNSQPTVLTTSGSATFNDLFVTNVMVATNGIDNPTLSIVTNSPDGINFTLTISGTNLLGTIVSNNGSNIVYLSTLAKPFITVTFSGNTGTNATGTNTSITVMVVDTFPNQFTSGSAANEEPVVYTTISTSGGASFAANKSAISASFTIDPNSLVNPPVLGFASIDVDSGSALGFGNYTGLAFFSGDFYPAWADNSDVALINPNGPLSDFDVTVSQAVVPSADLTLFVTNSPNPVLSDGVVAYTIQAINNGPSASSCVVTDVLPANVTFESAVPSVGATYSINGQIFILTVPTIAAHSSATTLLLVTAGYSAYGTNVANIAGPLPDTDPANNTNILVTLFAGEDLALAESTSATNLFGGQIVTNVITITNLGPSANGDVTVSNVFSANWGLLTVLSEGWSVAPNALTTGTYSTNNNILVLNVGPLSSNESTNIVISATALATAPSGLSLISVSSLDFDPNPLNNSASIAVTMTPQSIGAGISAGSSQVGVPTTFTIIVTNFGPSPYGFITVSNVLPPNFSTISVVQSPNPAVINGNTIIFPVGAVGSNSTATLIFTAIPQSVGTATDTFVASSFDYAPSYSNSVLITATPPATPIESFRVIPASSGAFLVWDTPVNATVQVDYGLTVTYGSISSLSGPSTHHVVLLTGLVRGTNYYFNALTWENGTLYVTNGTFATVNTLILNTQDAFYFGPWTENSSGTGIFGSEYFSASTTVSDPGSSATYTPLIPAAGNYDVSIWYPQSSAFATNTPVFVSGATNEIFNSVNQTLNGGSWQPLDQDVYFAAGLTGNVAIYNNTGVTNKAVAANGMRWVYDAAQDDPTNGAVPAWWATFYFGTNNVAGLADEDGDGYSNFAEYVFGTDPTNAASKLIFTVAPLPGKMVSVNFSPYQGGRVYQLLSSTDLADPQWLTLTNVATADTNGDGVFILTQPNPAAGYYRLSATLSP
jgi:uncharacterized repeat protein (TIGR01451 family)